MTLIAIILALSLERVLSYSPQWRAHNLTGDWMRWVDTQLQAREPWAFLIYAVVPLLAVALLWSMLVQAPGLGMLRLPLEVLLILACLGSRDLAEEVSSYAAARRSGERAAAEAVLSDLLRIPHARSTSVVRALFVQGHERWFAVLLWYFVLGPLGAVSYRIMATVSQELAERDAAGSAWADDIHGAMAWPSARLTGLAYALAGSAEHALARLRQSALSVSEQWREDAWPLLADVGVAALGQGDANTRDGETMLAAVHLMERALLIVLAVLSLFTLGGWLS